MDNFVKEFIKEELEDIENNDWDHFYAQLYYTFSRPKRISEINSILLTSGINPLDYLNRIPEYYLYQTDIEEIKLPKNVFIIQDQAFANCSKLQKINLENIDLIGKHSFAYCFSLDTLKMKEKVQIENFAFSYAHIKKLILPNSFDFKYDSFLASDIDEIIYDGSKKEYENLTSDLNSVSLSIPNQIKYLR